MIACNGSGLHKLVATSLSTACCFNYLMMPWPLSQDCAGVSLPVSARKLRVGSGPNRLGNEQLCAVPRGSFAIPQNVMGEAKNEKGHHF